MKVVVVGIDRSPHLGKVFKEALEGMGHVVCVVDERRAHTLLDRRPFRILLKKLLAGRTSAHGLFRFLLLRACERFRPDLILAVKGPTIDSELLREIRMVTKAPRVMYSTDNPFNPAVSSQHNIDALAHWDAIATPRRNNVAALKERCPGEVFYLPFGYDPKVHYPERPATPGEEGKYRSDVVFIGACDADRVPYLDPLARSEDISVSLYGSHYRYTPALRRHARGLVYNRDYRLAICGSKVALALVRHANGDGHVMRTFEIPACGAFMLTERTAEHEEMFEEGREAVFFSSPEEMLDKARYYAGSDATRRKIAEEGYRRTTGTPNTYADRLKYLLEHAG